MAASPKPVMSVAASIHHGKCLFPSHKFEVIIKNIPPDPTSVPVPSASLPSPHTHRPDAVPMVSITCGATLLLTVTFSGWHLMETDALRPFDL